MRTSLQVALIYTYLMYPCHECGIHHLLCFGWWSISTALFDDFALDGIGISIARYPHMCVCEHKAEKEGKRMRERTNKKRVSNWIAGIQSWHKLKRHCLFVWQFYFGNNETNSRTHTGDGEWVQTENPLEKIEEKWRATSSDGWKLRTVCIMCGWKNPKA